MSVRRKLAFCILLLLALQTRFVVAESMRITLASGDQLLLTEAISAEQTEAAVRILPLDIPAKVANRILLQSKQPISREQLQSIMGYGELASLQSLELLLQYGERYVYQLQVDTLKNSLALCLLLQRHPHLESVQPDVLPLRERPSDARHLNSVLHANAESVNVNEMLGLDAVWQKTRGQGVRVAVIDMGVSLYHPSLQQVKLHYGWDIDVDVIGAAPSPGQTHGNKVAGIIWARPQLLHPVTAFSPGSAWGVAPESELIALRLQRPWTSNLLKAFSKAEQQRADVINVSWLLAWVAEPLRDYLRYLVLEANHKKGIVIVASAAPVFQANTGLAAMPELFVVSSTDHRGVLANSSWDEHVDLAAPSYLLTVSQLPDRDYETFAKTSSSAALVSGWVALLRATRPDMSAVQVQALLINTATRATQKVPDAKAFEYRVLNAPESYRRLIAFGGKQ